DRPLGLAHPHPGGHGRAAFEHRSRGGGEISQQSAGPRAGLKMRIAARDGHHHRKARKQFMRWIVVLCLLGVTACGQIPGAGTGESTALGQTGSTRWQDQGGKLLSVPEVEQAYRACQNSMFSPLRASAATITP